ncbi:MAG: hypothetical protein HYZ53_03945 [Planctomycetes bacterium]|nr:hypothetical protein [Planctomycetota bacterium]
MVRRAVFTSAVALVLCFTSHASRAAHAAPPPVDPLLLRPAAEKGPTPVAVGLEYADFQAIHEEVENFSAMGHLHVTWNDPRLAFDPATEGTRSKPVRKEDIWTPDVQIMNSPTVDRVLQETCRIAPDGTVRVTTRFSLELNTPMDFRLFPFDRQLLRFTVEPLNASLDEIVLLQDEEHCGVGADAFLSDWDFGELRVEQRAGRLLKTEVNFSRLTFSLEIRRRANFFVHNILVPTLLFVVLSWVVFWVSIEDISTMLGVTITVLLTIEAFGVAVDSSLPKIPYPTLMFHIQRSAFIAILLNAFENTLVYHLSRSGQGERALRIRGRTRWAMPMLFVAVLTGHVAWILR